MATKLQRWVDLLAALLSRSRPATFVELAAEMPEFSAKLREYQAMTDESARKTAMASMMRSFERDKAELREFGVPIQTLVNQATNDSSVYRLDRKTFYLPYLSMLTAEGGTIAPRKVDRYGYQALSSLSLSPDELAAVVDGASVMRALGDPLLASAIESALRKLAVDLPLDAVSSIGEPAVMRPRARPDNAVFEELSDALQRRKTVRFDYHALSSDAVEARDVEPHGLFFLHGHWYLVANDLARRELRNFRLNRISSPTVNAKQGKTADFEIPSTFRLRDHASSRHAWELGESDAVQVVVAVRDSTGPTRAAANLGQPVEGRAEHRTFSVRRSDTFVRWLMSFSGALEPVEPENLVAQYREQARAVRALYDGDAHDVGGTNARAATSVDRAPGATAAPSIDVPWQPKGAAAQLRRILQLVPEIADGEEHDIGELAARIGSDVSMLQKDLNSLVERYDLPGGFIEGVQLFLESGRVSATTNHFQRPMRLTSGELSALVLGLSVLRTRRTPAEHEAIEGARLKLQQIAVQVADDPVATSSQSVSLADGGDPALIALVHGAIRTSSKLRISYRKSGSDASDTRVVCPYMLAAANGTFYLVAHCDREQGVRMFRFDRIETIETVAETFQRPADFDPEALLRDGRMFSGGESEAMTVRYSPRIARWIAEREGRQPDADGALVMEHPLADSEWAVRHVLQYGPDAEVLAPAHMRTVLRERLEAMVQPVL